MGKFDGFLICSDIDGTFRGSEGTAEVNGEAVKYFMSEGGRFTFSTGRMVAHLKETGLTEYMNAPACVCNGAIIYDYGSEKLLRTGRTGFTIGEFIGFLKKNNIENATVYYCEEAFLKSFKKEDYGNLPEEVLKINPLKMMCEFATAEEAEEFKRISLNEKKFFSNTHICKSWKLGVEFNGVGSTKGDALMFIKEHLGNIHTAIGIGDYENDYTLIEKADLGVAVGNADESLKKIADLTVKKCDEYAIKDLIEILEKNYLKGE